MRDHPVLIDVNGEPRLFVFPDWMTGGDCTGKTKKNQRCRNVAWDQGQVAGYETVFVGDRMVEVYGPLPAAVGWRHYSQRCHLHHTPDAQAYCDPEWVPFDLERHHDLTSDPTLFAIPGLQLLPPLRPFGLALRAHFSPAERQQLAGILTEGL
ncbi:hypothetical protein [Streptosporangium sandarakinum]|uniref:hypothetical protein n=1 Tax=Streptosporangium sandarakinum TaxID=1260955 RepID=UPI0036B286F8